MVNQTISSGGTYALSAPLTNGTNIEFLNQAGDSGVLIVGANPANDAFNVVTSTINATLTTSAYIGGSILNFQPGTYGISGDEVTITHITSLFSALDVASTAAADDVDFANHVTTGAGVEQYLIEPDGAIVDPATLSPTFTAIEIATIDEMAAALFGTATAADGVTLDLAFIDIQNPNSNTKFADAVFTATNAAINPCFVAGTLILTPHGDVPVELLRAGDLVIGAQGEEREIMWAGRRVVDVARHPRPDTVRPVLIEAGALADGVPARRLLLSPDHALLLDGVLVPAKYLLNWNTIRQDAGALPVSYHHLELARHGVVFAEGAPAESFLDTGHRGIFDNAPPSDVIAHPALMQRRRTAESFAPVCTGGAALAAIRARLAVRQVGIRLG